MKAQKKNPSLLILLLLLMAGCLPACSEIIITSKTATPTPPVLAEITPIAELQGLGFDEFLEASWRILMLRSPESILEAGLTDIYQVTDVRLNDISDAYQRETFQVMAGVLAALHTYDRLALAPKQQISRDIYEWYLQDQLAGQEFMYHDYPATYFPTTAVQETLIQFFTDIHPIENLQDARDYVTRLEQVGTKMDQLIEGLQMREEAGITPPDFAIQWETNGSLAGLIHTAPTDTLFYTALELKLTSLSAGGDNQALLEEAEQAITEVVLPAYTRLADFLSSMKTYQGAEVGVGHLPDGERYYTYLLRHYTSTDLTATEIHQLGLQELERIHTEMQLIFDQLGYPQEESVVRLFNRVAQDGGHISGNGVLAAYEGLIAEADRKLGTVIDILPRAEVVVKPDPFGGYYIPGSVDGSRPGAFYAGVSGTGEDAYAMPTLTYHEAIPGHHLQISLAQEMEDLPSFRRGAIYNAYSDGWALYAERLVWELGWYKDDPYGNLGRLQAEAFRAARLVVDTGLHAQGWTFDQARQFFTENTGFEAGDSVDPQLQIARYIVWPGQATSYYVGFLKILELRQSAMDQLGDQFDLKEFHRVILSNGSMPLEILEHVVDEYITSRLAGGG